MSRNVSDYIQQGKTESQKPSWSLNNYPPMKQDDIVQPKLYEFTEYLEKVFKIHDYLRQINKKGQLNIYSKNITNIKAEVFNKIPVSFLNKNDFLEQQFKYIYTDQLYQIIHKALLNKEEMEKILIEEIQKLQSRKYDSEQEIKMISKLMSDILQNNE